MKTLEPTINLLSPINSQRRAELRKDKNYIHIMKYMGSKRELLPDIKEVVSDLLPNGGGLLDLFAGTGSVGLYLKNDYTILSNDIQEYSKALTLGLIGSCSKEISTDVDFYKKKLFKHFQKNQSALRGLASKTINLSNDFIKENEAGWSEKARKEYLRFFDNFPSPVNEFKSKSEELIKIKDFYFEGIKKNKTSPHLQTFFLFAETYFSSTQCVDIDSIRYAIEKAFSPEDPEYHLCLTALIYAHSYCSSGTGHFAMFRDLKDVKSITDVFLYRKRDVWSYFEKKLIEILEFHEYSPKLKHESTTMDFLDILNDKGLAKKYQLVYADPPYSFVHYSRFYHATESLVKYDYAVPQFKGRYRGDRHQSPFCQGLNVEKAFTDMFKSSFMNKKILVLSYSDTGMISLAKLLEVAEGIGFKCIVKEISYNHSTLGREGHKTNLIKEYIVTFDPRRIKN